MNSACNIRNCPLCRLKTRLNRFLLGPLRVLFYTIIFTTYSLLANVIQVVTLLTLKWSTAITVHAYICGFLWTILQFVFECMQGGKFTVSGDELPEGENALILANHLEYSDFFFINYLATRKKMVSHCKYFVKNCTKWVPGFGWGMYMMGMVFLKRSMRKDKTHLKQSLSKLTKAHVPAWFVLYPEGGRFNEARMETSNQFAFERDLRPLTEVLVPRWKGFILVMEALRKSNVKHVYDLTLSCRHKERGPCKPPTLYEIFASPSLSAYKFHIHVKRHEIARIPTGHEDLKEWLYERFAEKDAYLKLEKEAPQVENRESLPWTWRWF